MTMKFHHLARHSQLVAAHQPRALSPAKPHQNQNQNQAQQPHQQQSAVKLHKQYQQLGLTDDDEDGDDDDEFVDGQTYYETVAGQRQPPPGPNGRSNQQRQQLDASQSAGFIMDKNKKLFPQKLWELIHNPSIQHCLRWSQDGQRVYLNRNEFEAYYLKTPNNQFHTQKAISFVRQMNMYGFRKVDDCYYENDNFRRDRQHLLRNMIRRHPNKGLFVGLDHHQLAAAAAAHQALQVNQQLQQLEQEHKQRTEQALRLNSYLSGHHHFGHHQQSALAGANQLHNHSSPFEHMSSQLARAAANHLSQQHQQPHIADNGSLPPTGNGSINGPTSGQAALPVHQPKKSRLLGNFYAHSANGGPAAAHNRTAFSDTGSAVHRHRQHQHQLAHNQDSMHSTSSVDTQPSQCSSALNSGSAGSPQSPNSPSALLHHQQQQHSATRLGAAMNGHRNQPSGASIRAAVLAAAQEASSKFAPGANQGAQLAATDLSTRQALHQTLVRSLLQLKQQQQQAPQSMIGSLQHQHQHQSSPKTLLESLASLSSAGTGSIVDPTSNSPTERTATPPSGSPSPASSCLELGAKYNEEDEEEELELELDEETEGYIHASNNPIALDLAKSSACSFGIKRSHQHLDQFPVDVEAEEEEAEETEVEEDCESGVHRDERSETPIGIRRRVRRYLERQRVAREEAVTESGPASPLIKVKEEPEGDPPFEQFVSNDLPQKKRIKLGDAPFSEVGADEDRRGWTAIVKSLITEICERRGERLDVAALNEAARYTECFLEILLDDAALIARHSANDDDTAEPLDKSVKSIDRNDTAGKTRKSAAPVDCSSLSLALKLIPSKLLVATQQYASSKTHPSGPSSGEAAN